MSKEKPSLDDLNPEQRQRLLDFKADNGRFWKRSLNDMWLCGKDANQHDGHLLRQIRNQFGPVWLDNLRI